VIACGDKNQLVGAKYRTYLRDEEESRRKEGSLGKMGIHKQETR